MRRQIIVMFCLLFGFACAAAADSGAPQPARGALFKVVRGDHTLYLFGTIHVGAADFYPLEAGLTAALARAGALALEIDPLADPARLQAALRRHGLYADGAAAPLAPALRPRLERQLQRYAIAPESVAPMKPWLLASVLALGAFAAQGLQPELAVDTYLARQARARGIALVELESVDAQMALFAGMTARAQERFLEEGIAALEDGSQARQASAIARAWRGADIAAFDALAREAALDTSFSGRFMQRVLLDGRNRALADGVARLLARETDSVAAIGVLHLLGAQGVPALLRQRGLQVERVY